MSPHTTHYPDCKANSLCTFSQTLFLTYITRIGGIMVSVLVSSAVDRGFEPRSGKTKDYKNGICCFSAKHVALRRKCKDCLPCNQDNVSYEATFLSSDC
jgi:7-cyano-7-deazaguanine synthase in queuosine biosynthesis